MTNDQNLTTFLDLCDPFRQAISSVPSDEGWNYISHLSKLHGVTPFLYYRARSLGIKLPEQIEKEWLGHYLYQIAQEQKARRQIKELKEILDPKGILFILLKGASAMLRLYPQPGLRTFVDLDILIPENKVSQFKQAMMESGYKPLSARNSPEDEELQRFDQHLDPLRKEESLMIEPHLSILGVGGRHLFALPQIWKEKEEISSDGPKVDHLNRDQFVAHTMFHSSRHLSGEGFTEIKWFIDLLYALKRWRIDWEKVWDISRKWGIEKDILSVMATMNQYWQTRIPLPIASKPIAPDILVSGIRDRQKEYYAKLPTSYIERFLKIKELPNVASQLRYVLHLFFPTRENLRWRYNLSSKWSIMPYYCIHLIVTSRKFFAGLWYQFLYHSQ